MVKLHISGDSTPVDRYEDYVGQEGLIAWLKDVSDRIKSNSGVVKYKHCRQLLADLKTAKDFDYSDMADREAGKPLYKKSDLAIYMAAIGPAEQFIKSKITPFFKKAMSCSAKDIENYYNKTDWSKADKKNPFEVNDRAAFELWKEIRDNMVNPIRKMMRYTYEGWFYEQKNTTDDWIDLKKLYTDSKTYKQLGYNAPADFAPLFQMIIAESDMKDSTVFGKMYSTAFELDKLCFELLEKKIRGKKYTDLPTGLYYLYQVVNRGIFHTVYTQDSCFWVPAMTMNCDGAINRVVYRLARVLGTQLD